MNKCIGCIYYNEEKEKCAFSSVKNKEPEKVNTKCLEYVDHVPLKEFIRQEVRFRLNEILNISTNDAVIEMIAEALYDDSDIMFNYDKIDEFIEKHYYSSEVLKEE